MPLTLGARNSLKWNSRLVSPRVSSRRRKSRGLQLGASTCSIVCLILFITMILCCFASGSDPIIDKCEISSELSTSQLCRCLSRCKSRELVPDYIKRCNLTFCGMIRIQEALSVLMNATLCSARLEEIFRVDQTALQDFEKFQEIIRRIDCEQNYSVKWKCEDCEKAYKNWLCYEKVLPVVSPKKLKPCVSLCRRVLQRCPYFLPGQDYQWSGQSAFECDDVGYDQMLESKDEEECFNVTSSSILSTSCPSLTSANEPAQQLVNTRKSGSHQSTQAEKDSISTS